MDRKKREIEDLHQLIADREVKLTEAQNAQAELIRKQRELDDRLRELDLTVETRVQQSLATVRNKAKEEAEAGLKLKLMERDEQVASMARQIEDLKRKAE